jgi:hypothetical protein
MNSRKVGNHWLLSSQVSAHADRAKYIDFRMQRMWYSGKQYVSCFAADTAIARMFTVGIKYHCPQ